jgi:hypothetical protein
MTLSDLASIGSLVSGIAVAVTLTFLQMQMRQANRDQRSLMQQGRAERYTSLLAWMTEARMSDIFVRADAGDLSLSAPETFAHFRLCAAWFWSLEDSFVLHRAGMLDDLSWEGEMALLTGIVSIPSMRVAWQWSKI